MIEFFVECKPDEVLVKKLGASQRYIRRCNGKGNIFNEIRKTQKTVLALIDEDPGTNRHRNFTNLLIKENTGDFKVYIDNKNNVFIELSVNLENWILLSCRKSNINIQDKYGLPKEEKELHKVINDKLDKFELLIDDLLSQENCNLLALKNYITNHMKKV